MESHASNYTCKIESVSDTSMLLRRKKLRTLDLLRILDNQKLNYEEYYFFLCRDLDSVLKLQIIHEIHKFLSSGITILCKFHKEGNII